MLTFTAQIRCVLFHVLLLNACIVCCRHMAFKEAKNAALKEMKAKVLFDATLIFLSHNLSPVDRSEHQIIFLNCPSLYYFQQVVREFKKREGGKGMGKMKWDAQVRLLELFIFGCFSSLRPH